MKKFVILAFALLTLFCGPPIYAQKAKIIEKALKGAIRYVYKHPDKFWGNEKPKGELVVVSSDCFSCHGNKGYWFYGIWYPCQNCGGNGYVLHYNIRLSDGAMISAESVWGECDNPYCHCKISRSALKKCGYSTCPVCNHSTKNHSEN